MTKTMQEQPKVNGKSREELAREMGEKTQETLAACRQEVISALKKHGCALAARAYLTEDGRIEAEPFIAIKPA